MAGWFVSFKDEHSEIIPSGDDWNTFVVAITTPLFFLFFGVATLATREVVFVGPVAILLVLLRLDACAKWK